MLKITKSSEPIETKTIVTCIYAQPGIGKTTLAFTAEKPLLLDTDRGSHRARNRKDIVRVESWADIADITAEDLATYKTLIVDTAGRALDFLALDIIKSDAKAGRGGALTIQGYGTLKTRFTAWTTLIRSFGLDVILIAHMSEEGKGEETKERLDIQGGSKGEVYKSADLMGRIYLNGGKRTVNFNPSDTAFGKNPGQLAVMEIPDYNADPAFFAGVIAQTKAELNRLSEEQVKAGMMLADWQTKIEAAATAEEFNALIEPAKGADETVRDNVKRLLVKIGKGKGLTFDKGAFSGKASETGKAPAPTAESQAKATPATAPAAEGGPNGAAQKILDAQAAEKPADRVPGEDDGDEADRNAAAPTAEEIEKLGPPPASAAAATTAKSKKKAAA